MLEALRAAYDGPWSAQTQRPKDKGVIVDLSPD
jgi:hypothetical protein